MERHLEALLDPTGRAGDSEQVRLAPRDGVLAGRSIGLLNSTKPNSPVLLEELGALLRDRFGAERVTLFSKASFAVPLDEALLAQMAEQCDYAIAGVGD